MLRHTHMAHMLFLPHLPSGTPHATEKEFADELHIFRCQTIGSSLNTSRSLKILAAGHVAKKISHNLPANGVFLYSKIPFMNQSTRTFSMAPARFALVRRTAPRLRTFDMASMLRNLVETMKRHPGPVLWKPCCFSMRKCWFHLE